MKMSERYRDFRPPKGHRFLCDFVYIMRNHIIIDNHVIEGVREKR